ncbi:hypothetical protein FOA52_005702 [Chlamydomonas sp. UWO 241]|nr:hypothetical protein FOA52_005702 [Chlamydomonas sp. UWO 241]
MGVGATRRHASTTAGTPAGAGGSPTTPGPPLRVCVVGTGPAGFYSAGQLLKRLGDGVRVDLLDRLPTPYGLVRSGVAPDHQEAKNVTNGFSAIGQDARVRFFGGVTLGVNVQLAELRGLYDAVVLAYGAEADRHLGVPGEHAANVLPARQFVWWYNAHPDMARVPLDLSRVESVAVCGIGNVALDCARVLLKGAAGLSSTDASDSALAALAAATGRLKDVHIFARRGPVQAARNLGKSIVKTQATE